MQKPPSMSLDTIMAMMATLVTAKDTGETTGDSEENNAAENPEETIAMLAVLYDATVAEYRPLVKAAAPIIAAVGADIGLILSIMVDSINGVGTSPELQASLATMATMRAEARARSVKTYEGAGFTRAEAMALTLQDVANAKAVAQQFQEKVAADLKKPRTRTETREVA